jgi:hypothetical protein
VDVGGKRLQRRDVDDPHLVRQTAVLQAFPEQLIQGSQERGKRLPRARGRGDEGMFALADRAPAFELGRGGLFKAARPPALQDGMKIWG